MLFQARGGMVTEAAINQVDNLNLPVTGFR